MNQQKKLMQRFPYMFSGHNLGISIAKGWMPVVTKLCEDIDTLLGKDKQGFVWVQIKEKFGSGRFYFRLVGRRSKVQLAGPAIDGATPNKTMITGLVDMEVKYTVDKDLVLHLNALVEAAQALTERICIECGAAGAPVTLGGQQFILCPLHIAQRQGPSGHGESLVS